MIQMTKFFVNVKYIDWFYSYRGATSTFMSTLKDNLNVKETPEEILKKIANAGVNK